MQRASFQLSTVNGYFIIVLAAFLLLETSNTNARHPMYLSVNQQPKADRFNIFLFDTFVLV